MRVGSVCLAVLGALAVAGCRAPAPSSTDAEGYAALYGRCRKLLEELHRDAPLLTKSGNARRLLSLRQNEGFAPLTAEPYGSIARVSPDTAAFRIQFGKLEKQLSKQFSVQQKEQIDKEAKIYAKAVTVLEPLFRGAELWMGELRADRKLTAGWKWDEEASRLDVDEGFLMTRHTRSLWIKKLVRR